MSHPVGRPVRSTYRFQLGPGRGFAAVAAAADHLADLGVSHAYLSPVLAAGRGSTHGYDVVDHARINPELGGEEGLLAAAEALHRRGIGLVVDVVPNHMAIPVPESLNAVLWSVLRDGPTSGYARWFDVDWREHRSLLVPVLGRPIDEVLDAGDLSLDELDGEPVVRYFDHVFPVRRGTEGLPLEALLDSQHYRLAYWQVSDEEVNYRRFFDVDTLVAVRVEDEGVFDATHELLLRLVDDGVVDGLRIDHPDGLADPRRYLRRLASRTDGAWVVVEKILEPGELLPNDWACAGTTGYDALRMIGGALVDPAGRPALVEAFAGHTGVDAPFADVVEQAKRDVLDQVLAAEVDRLAASASAVCQAELRLRDHSRRGLREALVELLVAMPVYRAYVVPGEPAPPAAVALVEEAAGTAVERRPGRAADIRLVRDLVLGRLGRSPAKDELLVRFQQTCGPVMAKGLEDTAFYRWFPLVGLAEVGGEPDAIGVAPDELHTWARQALVSWPEGMSTLSTHDTKRSEDVRARLSLLSEVPWEWATAVRAWHAAAPFDEDLATEWFAWQTLVGAWPVDAERLWPVLQKSAREAKRLTSWTAPDEEFEKRLEAWLHDVLADADLVRSLEQMVERLHPGFASQVLAQRLLLGMLPGVPDTYQGCEVVDLSLVDPDNRREPDAGRIGAALDRARGGVDPVADLDAAKAKVVRATTRLRADHPEWFGRGSLYLPLAAEGDAADHVLSLARGAAGADAVAVATRLPLRLASRGGWAGTSLELPDGRWTDVLTGAEHEGGSADVSALLGGWPVALLVREDAVP